MKLRCTVLLGLGLKDVKIARNVAKVSVNAMGIQIYYQVSILRTWSKMKLHRAVLLGFGLEEPKIALNIMKVGMQSYLPNSHLNI